MIITRISPSQPTLTFGAGIGVDCETPTISSATKAIKIEDGTTLEYPLLDLLSMYIFQGKKLDQDVKEYIDVILRAPNMDNIRAMASFKRFKDWVEKK